MKQSLFQIGEDVVLQSQDYPNENGIQSIEQIRFMENPIRDTTFEELPPSFGYKLLGIEGWWNEKSIKKIHKPSQFSFDQLISEIKCPSNIV